MVAVAAQSRFVSRYATEAVAGLGIVKKLDQLPLYFSIGVSNGLLPLLAYHYAAGQQEKRRAAFRLGCTLSLAFALLCLVTFELFAPQLASSSSTTQPPFITAQDFCGEWSSPCP
ncbi:MAG: MATE family efflux transporter [Evtepia gabavorous]